MTYLEIYLLKGNYHQQNLDYSFPFTYGEIYCYDIADDGTMSFNASIQTQKAFPVEVSGSYNDYGCLVDGDIEIDHASEGTEKLPAHHHGPDQLGLRQRPPVLAPGQQFKHCRSLADSLHNSSIFSLPFPGPRDIEADDGHVGLQRLEPDIGIAGASELVNLSPLYFKTVPRASSS